MKPFGESREIKRRICFWFKKCGLKINPHQTYKLEFWILFQNCDHHKPGQHSNAVAIYA